MRRALAPALIAALASVLVACGSDDAGPKADASSATVGQTASSSAAASASASAAESPDQPTPLDLSGPELAGFTADDQAIACLFDSLGDAPAVRCDVLENTWSTPEKPTDCQGDWGLAAGLTAGAAGELLCVSDTVVGIPKETDGSRELPAGTLARYGQLACLIQDTGVSCYDTASGEHSLFVSMHTYEVI